MSVSSSMIAACSGGGGSAGNSGPGLGGEGASSGAGNGPAGGGGPGAAPSGAPTIVATLDGQTGAEQLRIFGGRLYFLSRPADRGSYGTVQMIPTTGGTAITIGAGRFGDPGGLAVDATGVYWTNPVDMTVLSAPLTGGPTAVALTPPVWDQSVKPMPTGVAVSNGFIMYYSPVSGMDLAIAYGGRVGGKAQIYSGGGARVNGILADGDRFLVSNQGDSTRYHSAAIRGVALDGSGDMQMAQDDGILAVAVDASSLSYLTDLRVMTQAKDPHSHAVPLDYRTTDAPVLIASDARRVYYGCLQTAICMADKDGSAPPKRIYESPGRPTGLAVDDSGVYFITSGNDRVTVWKIQR